MYISNANADCDNFKFGIYLCSAIVKNTPSAEWWLILSAGDTGTSVQVAYALSGNAILKRSCAGGAWSNWESPKISASTIPVQLTYESNTEMRAEINAAGTPIALTINTVAQTPYDTVAHTSITRIGNTVRCSAFGSGFISGHVLSGEAKFLT